LNALTDGLDGKKSWTRKHTQFDKGNFNDANGGKNKEMELDP